MPTNIVLTRIDTAPVEFTQFPPEFERWLGVLVDNINTAFQQIEVGLASLDARVTALGG